MRTRSNNPFSTVTTSGLLLPIDLLVRIADGDPDLKGLKAKDYHLRSGERLNEAAARAWSQCLSAWKSFRKRFNALPASDIGTTTTRDEWLLPLFQELGYGRLQTKKALDFDGTEYPISHGWEDHIPTHLLSARLPLDRRTAGVSGAAARAPYSLLQELLNRSATHRWGFVTNGLKLYLLRDNAALARAANVEFDLEAMMDGEVYYDFFVLFCLCHQSRVEIRGAGSSGPLSGKQNSDTQSPTPDTRSPEDCWLEDWANQADQQGTRAREKLRDGVEASIKSLGAGFLTTKGNDALRAKLRSGELSTQDYYRQLLRLVYRILMLLVAEEKRSESGDNLLHPPGTSLEVRDRYARYYSVGRVRSLAYERRGTAHSDLYESLKVLFLKLRTGYEPLGIPGMGSFLFSEDATPDLDDACMANQDLLDAFRNLCYTDDTSARGGGIRRPVDFGNLGSEELGSVYESLLELHPLIDTDEGPFTLGTAAGHERKTTSSYYTPTSLINCLLDSALDPVVHEAINVPDPAEAERKLLDLKVCDPACGSGHFLIAAADRMAMHLARIRTGDDQPNTIDVQHAKRDIIGRCIYGVDMNPMAVELCKVSLWMEALEPGKPLSFLDHHIQCGNSLIGATPRLLAEGIPDDAFKPIEGDDNEVCKDLKARNRRERIEHKNDQGYLFDTYIKLGNVAGEFAKLTSAPDDSLEARAEKESQYAELVKRSSYQNARLWADTFCSSFVWIKSETELGRLCPTERKFRDIERSPFAFMPSVRDEVFRLSERYRFFHWHLAFPDVFRFVAKDEEPTNAHAGWNGGFDVMLGNPPWDTLSPDAKEFFSSYDEQVRSKDKAGQNKLIESLLQSEDIANAWIENRRDIYAGVHFLKNSGRYRLFAPGNLGKGDFNVFRMFVETAMACVRTGGCASQIVPDGLYGGANSMAIRRELFNAFTLDRVWGFENAGGVWFDGVHRSAKFCLYSAREGGKTSVFNARFCIRSERELSDAKSGDGLTIPVSLVHEFSPDALAITEVASQYEIDIAQKMYSRWPKFGALVKGTAKRHYMAELHMGNDRDRFGVKVDGYPLYEGRMVSQFDHRAKGYRSGRGRKAVWEDLKFSDPNKSIQPQWRVSRDDVPDKITNRMKKYRIGFCDVASPTNERSLVAALLPANSISGHKVPTIVFVPEDNFSTLVWLAVANSFCMDFLVRQKVGLTMSYTLLDSQPFPRLKENAEVSREIAERVLLLTCTGEEMVGFWNVMADQGWCNTWVDSGDVPGVTDEEERLRLIAELNVIVGRDLYKLTASEIDYILGTFPTTKKYEIQKYNEFRSKRLISELYESLPRFSIESPEATEAVADDEDLLGGLAYPSPGYDYAVCAAAMQAVDQLPALESAEHLDVLLLASHAQFCRPFLNDADVARLDELVAAKDYPFRPVDDQGVQWLRCRDYLERRNALQVNRDDKSQRISKGDAFDTVVAEFKTGTSELVALAVRALELIRLIRQQLDSADPVQRLVIERLDEARLLYQLAA